MFVKLFILVHPVTLSAMSRKLAVQAVMVYPKQEGHVDRNMDKYLANVTACRRDTLFQYFEMYSHVDSGVKCLCCDVCAMSCTCCECQVNQKYFLFL